MKILVTGGSGFIGSNFIRYWFDKHPDDEITNLDKLTYAADQWNLEAISGNRNYHFVRGDIADRELMQKLVSEADAVINFAAESHVDNSINDSREFINSNIIGVHSILEAVRNSGTRFHHVSTDEVYGSLDPDSSEKFSEGSCYNPRNPYSATKASADFLVKAYHNTYGIPATISNCSNNFGPNQHPEKLIPKTILNFLDNKPMQIYGNGRQVRDWIYVDDHCSALDVILKKGKYGETYLVSSGNEVRNIDLVTRIGKLIGMEGELVKHIDDRPGHDVRYALDASSTRIKLGWSPATGFEQGLQITIEHYRNNSQRYRKKLEGSKA